MQVFKSQRNALLAIAAAFLYWYVHFPLLSETIDEIKDAAHAAWSMISFYGSLCFFLVWLLIFQQGLCLPLAWSCTVFPAGHILWMDSHVAWGHIHKHFTEGHINCVVGTQLWTFGHGLHMAWAWFLCNSVCCAGCCSGLQRCSKTWCKQRNVWRESRMSEELLMLLSVHTLHSNSMLHSNLCW